MGKFRSDGDAIVQRIRMVGSGFGAMAYWNEHVFFACENDSLSDYAITKGELRLNTYSSTKFENPGATPSVSANGAKDGIVWAVATKTWNGPDQPAVLHAFDASGIKQPIYSSGQNGKRDRAASATRFVIPVVVNGRVYFGAVGEVEVTAIRRQRSRAH
jgi:hypothetical protein